MVRGTSEDSRVIQGTAIGGLNLTTSPLAMSLSDSPLLVNVDVGDSGSVCKRLGTRDVGPLPLGLFDAFPFTTNLGKTLLLTIAGQQCRIELVNNDELTIINTFVQMFSQTPRSPFDFTVLPGKNTRVMICSDEMPPIIFTIHELRVRALSNTTELRIEDVDNTFASSPFVTLNGGLGGVAYSYSVLNSTAIFTGVFSTGDVVDALKIDWSWGAEGLLWYGEDFYRSVYRANSTPADRLVAIPDTINSDLEAEHPYGIEVYQSAEYGNTYVRTSQPQHPFEFGFSNGKIYEYDPNDVLVPSPFFVSFGSESGFLSYTFSDEDIVDSTFYIPNHGFSDYDIVTFDDSSIPGISNNTAYYIGVVDVNHFQLFTDPALTVQAITSIGPAVTFNDANINYDVSRVTGITPGYPIGGLS